MNTIVNNSLPAFYTPSATQGTAPTSPTSADPGGEESSFGSVLQNAIGGVEQLHTGAQEQVTQLASGDVKIFTM